jgi:hypothetical protein
MNYRMNNQDQTLAGPKRRGPVATWCVVVFVVGLLVRLALALALPNHRITQLEKPEPVQIALSLLATGRYADAYGSGTGPTAHCAPLHPILLWILFEMFGTGARGALAMTVFGSAAAAAGFALLPAVAVAGGLGLSSGVLAGMAGALLPVNFWAQTSGSFAFYRGGSGGAVPFAMPGLGGCAIYDVRGRGNRSSGRFRLPVESCADPGSGRMVDSVRCPIQTAIIPHPGVSRRCRRVRPVHIDAVGPAELQSAGLAHLDPLKFRAGIAGFQQ